MLLQKSEFVKGFDGLLLRRFTFLKAIVAFLFSSIGISLIQLLSSFELHSTSTAKIGGEVTKLAIYQLTNVYVVTILAVVIAPNVNWFSTPRSAAEQKSTWCAWRSSSWCQQTVCSRTCFSVCMHCAPPAPDMMWQCRYSSDGFAETALIIQLLNSVLPSLAFVFRVPELIMVHFFSRAAHSQAYVDGWLDPQPFLMAQRLSQARFPYPVKAPLAWWRALCVAKAFAQIPHNNCS